MDWQNTKIDGIDAYDYLRKHYLSKTDAEIAKIVSEEVGKNVTKEAVKKARYRIDLKKMHTQESKPQPKTFETDGNEATASCEASDVDELIKKIGIDTDMWQLQKFRRWEGFAKVEGELVTIPLTSAHFIRINPKPIIPTVKPVACDREFNTPAINTGQRFYRELVFSDPHFGYKRKSIHSDELVNFHDRRALAIILEYAKETQPEIIRILGDIFDFSEFTDRFARSPEFAFMTQPAINDAYAFLKKLRETCPDAQIILHCGNHEDRMQRMIIKHIPYAYGIKSADEIELPPALSVPRLLALHKLGIQYTNQYPNDYVVSQNGLIEYDHGQVSRSRPYATVKAIVADSDITRCVGHIHRIESAPRTIWRGSGYRTIQAHSFGCTCRLDRVVPGKKQRQNWQNGFGVIYHTPSNYNILSFEIQKGVCLTDIGIITSQKENATTN